MIERPSPHQSPRDGHSPQMIVIHGDAGRTDEGTASWIESPDSGVSYHYLVGREGDIYRFVDESEKAWHAGRSQWGSLTVDGSVNPTSVGVAFANDGTGDEMYTEHQYRAGAKLCAEICERYSIPVHLIRGHHEVSPGRKTDPWDWFDWRRFFALLGMYATGRAA